MIVQPPSPKQLGTIDHGAVNEPINKRIRPKKIANSWVTFWLNNCTEIDKIQTDSIRAVLGNFEKSLNAPKWAMGFRTALLKSQITAEPSMG